MLKQVTALSALALLGFAGFVQDSKKTEEGRGTAEQKVATEDSNRKNPVKPSPTSIAEGKQLYDMECSMCHGIAGDGKGNLAQDMKLNMLDWRVPNAFQSFADGDLFQIISNGKGKMTGEEKRVKPEQIWDMVNYIRTFARKDLPQKSKDGKPKG